MSFWETVWAIVIVFAFVAYLMVLFSILGDLFRDRSTGGFAKAIWIIFLIVLPLVTSLVYLVARGDGMAKRAVKTASDMQEAQESYIKSIAGQSSPADEIAKAKALLDGGTISIEEYLVLKARALA